VLDPRNDSQATWVGSAYRSDEQGARLKAKGGTSNIHDCADRYRPLTPEREAANTERSRVRVQVENVFGHLETALNECDVRMIGIARAQAKIGLEIMAYNISRFTFLRRDLPALSAGAARFL
jgi:transposase, IS5 family